ncbi:hypothetical protein [Nocardioides gansuensis]|uniref:hypothetical protein n=1 Tax=Nocardioides gansuensis TaxID=2138300 RepID=UPI001FE2D684|nr:hypothetical protein [Nocardioides gansuensis]
MSSVVAAIHPTGKVFHVRGQGATVLQSNWKHWPCLLPQHGPGRKHERPIILEPWQREVVEAFPADFLRGPFHSDGCRVDNWATRVVRGERRRYDYGRWQFVNASDDIRRLCAWALDLLEIPWRRSGDRVISVSRREAVARLDELIGLKS